MLVFLSVSKRSTRRRDGRCEGVVGMRRKGKNSNSKRRESLEDGEIKRKGVRSK